MLDALGGHEIQFYRNEEFSGKPKAQAPGALARRRLRPAAMRLCVTPLETPGPAFFADGCPSRLRGAAMCRHDATGTESPSVRSRRRGQTWHTADGQIAAAADAFVLP